MTLDVTADLELRAREYKGFSTTIYKILCDPSVTLLLRGMRWNKGHVLLEVGMPEDRAPDFGPRHLTQQSTMRAFEIKSVALFVVCDRHVINNDTHFFLWGLTYT